MPIFQMCAEDLDHTARSVIFRVVYCTKWAVWQNESLFLSDTTNVWHLPVKFDYFTEKKKSDSDNIDLEFLIKDIVLRSLKFTTENRTLYYCIFPYNF